MEKIMKKTMKKTMKKKLLSCGLILIMSSMFLYGCGADTYVEKSKSREEDVLSNSGESDVYPDREEFDYVFSSLAESYRTEQETETDYEYETQAQDNVIPGEVVVLCGNGSWVTTSYGVAAGFSYNQETKELMGVIYWGNVTDQEVLHTSTGYRWTVTEDKVTFTKDFSSYRFIINDVNHITMVTPNGERYELYRKVTY